ncbi:MAG: PepSY domain-containing protein [Calditrichaceae bacterium]|nr:PepSY domain-containing protein [Calditrichia bacterium]NUQ43106.1 PepSY domain-containing protein [Calditrichaceae bacterium]
MAQHRMMMFPWLAFVIVVILATAAQGRETVQPDGSILLPAQTESAFWIDAAEQQRLAATARWQNFVQRHGGWSVQWNEAARTPHRAYGEAIQIPGYSHITAENVEAASRAFLADNAAALGIDLARLQLQRAQQINRKWYVSFVQMQEGVEVLLSEVELRIFDNARVMAFGVDFYPHIDISLTPTLTFEQAKTLSTDGLTINPAADRISGAEKTYILPRRTGREVEFHLVYQVDIITENPEGNFAAFVDAHSGEIIWRHNRVRYAESKVKQGGMVQLVLPTDPFVEMPYFDQSITIGGVALTTNGQGVAARDITSPAAVVARLEGPWVNVNRQDGPDAIINTTLNPGDSLNLVWDDSNSHPAERDAFYHTNIIHNFVTALDPSFTGVNYSMPCAVNIAQTCNAFWNGTGINFYQAGGGCPNTGQMPSVVYHEYGHGINDKLYIQAGSLLGMINGATHEGMADVASAMIEDVPNVGRGFTGPGSTLRNLDNTNRYPENITGQVHSDGLIIGGAFWRLREASSLETARNLSHFAKWGRPDDPNTGVAFGEWFVEVLVADDDDGNLNNGTPNFSAINDAFNAHGIGSSLFMLFSFAHTPVEDTQDTLNAYPVVFHIEGFEIAGGQPDSLYVHYSTDGLQTVISLPAAPIIGQGNYQAEIPAQSRGSMVDYFITARDPLGNVAFKFPAQGAYNFLVGFEQIVLDELEVASGWVVGAPDDNATSGIWERANPQATSVGSQPEDDHTPTGALCFVTDGRNDPNNAGAYDVDGGKTTLFSPLYDMSDLNNPVFRYYKWYSNDRGATPGTDFWVVEASNDGGQSWVNVENTNVSTDGWEKFQIRVSDYLTPTATMQFRFVASDFGAGSLVEALVDDIEILALGGVTGIVDPQIISALPADFELRQNFPNPFNPSTTIEFALPASARVSLKIFNLLGQEVRTLAAAEKPAGRYSVVWDGRDNAGNAAASGVYVYKLEARAGSAGQRFEASRKLLLMK